MMVLELAEYYAVDLGWRVFPLAPESKRPATANGFHDATRDLATIRTWFTREPRCGIGLPCESIVVVDVDVRDGKPGRESLAELEREHGKLPETWTATTPSGGVHPYFVPAREVRRAIGVRPGIDLLGVGGYVCAPPTESPEGAYRWVDEDASLAALPGWVADLARARVEPAAPHPRPAPRWDDIEGRARRALAYVDACPPAISGCGGHDQTFRVALALVRGFELPRSVAAEILRYYSDRCDPPWSERELEHKLASAERAQIGAGYLVEGRP